ncbi:MAG: phosphoribosylaminoimidazolesuccinocarboxamide synthase [Spirochaetota bacterium]
MVDPQSQECFSGYSDLEVPAPMTFSQGKVRDVFYLDDELVISTSDRISAFDRILGEVPLKGEVLNRLSVFWFEKTEDIVANHYLATVSPRAMLAKKAHVIPVEVVVRGYLTGSAWRDYRAGRPVSGIELPPGMRFNERFDTPLITPSTKEADGLHDRPCSREEVLEAGVVDETVWNMIEEKALALYERGREIVAAQGLILVDTKYEFGLVDDELYLVDELHTPDSSRFWYADTYTELFESGEKQRKLDKEYLRQWLMDQGYQGDGRPPKIPEEVFFEVSRRYQQAFEAITGAEFRTQTTSSEAEKQKVLSFLAERQDDA